jgi:hypothetical protein
MRSRNVLLAMALFVTPNIAHAFYFPDWPGAVRAPRPSLIMGIDAVEPPTTTPPETITTTNPPVVPEPATLALAGIGLAIAGIRACRKSKGSG